MCVCVYMYTYISSGLGSLRSEWACYPIAFKIRVSCVGKLREDINTARARVFEEFNRPGDGSFYKQEHGYFSICLSVYLCIYLPNYLSYLTVYLSILRILSHTCLVCVHKYTYIYIHTCICEALENGTCQQISISVKKADAQRVTNA